MQITLYKNFKKKINSTKQPTGGTVVDVKLKNPTSRENPTFILNTKDLDYNYVKWGDHFYYISDIVVASNDHIEISCTQDILATYKSDILKTTAFVEYSTSAFNVDLLDHRISNTGAVTRATNSATPTNIFVSGGRYILSVVGNQGVADRYMITEAQLKSLGNKISTAGDSVVEDVGKRFGSFTNCIVGLMWIPYTMGAGVSDEIYLGTYATGVSALRIAPGATVNDTININIPWVSSNNGRKARETMTLYLPGYGTTTLDTSSYIGASAITIDIKADVTGTITYALHNPGGTIDYYNASCGAEIPVTSFTQSPIGMLLGVLSKAYSGESPFGEGLTRITQAKDAYMAKITSYLTNTGANVSCNGGQGSISLGLTAINNNSIYLTNKSFNYSESQEDMATKYGRPLMAVTSLSALTGYCKCNGASVDIDGLEGDKNEVNSYLNSGFYIE